MQCGMDNEGEGPCSEGWITRGRGHAVWDG